MRLATARARPRLAAGSQIIPVASGWIVKSASEVALLRVDGLAPGGDEVLDLLDGSRDLQAISLDSGIAPGLVSQFLDELRRLGMLDDEQERPVEMADRQGWLEGTATTPSPCGGALRVLLGGLGDLGLSVLRDLRRSGNVQGYLYDPAPVGGSDVGSFYRHSDIGHAKSQVVAACQDDERQPIFRHLTLDGSTPASLEAALVTPLRDVDIAIWCMDQPTASVPILAAACRSMKVPLVLADVDTEIATVGICSATAHDHAAGCAVCAMHHRAAQDPFRTALLPYLERRFPRPARWRHVLDPLTLPFIAKLVVLALGKAADVRCARRRDDNQLLSVDLEQRTALLLPVAKHHACRPCFPALPTSTRDLRRDAERGWVERYRQNLGAPLELAALWKNLRAVVGGDCALFQASRLLSSRERQSVWRFARERGIVPEADVVTNAHRVVSTRPAVDGAATMSIVSEGLDFYDPRAAECLSLVEGLERLFALDYCDPDRVVQARYTSIAADALDPRSFPLYADGQYREPNFGLRPFEQDTVLPWLWGIRIIDDRPVLVPRDLVYTSSSPWRIYRANSNGAACHSDYHRAVLNAIYETVERDAFMIAWLARLSCPRVSLTSADPDPFGVRRSLEALSFWLEHVDITTDLGIPVVLAVLRDRLNPSFFLVDMVSSLSAEEALTKLYREVVQFAFPYLIDQRHYQSPLATSTDFDQVTDFPDHLNFYQHPVKQRETAFLDSSPVTRAFAHQPSDQGPPVRERIADLVDRLARLGHEVIVVDCTAPLLTQLGLHAVKVIIPGLQPLSAGHRFRVLGGRRPLVAPLAMGMADRELTIPELNPWPHPFW